MSKLTLIVLIVAAVGALAGDCDVDGGSVYYQVWGDSSQPTSVISWAVTNEAGTMAYGEGTVGEENYFYVSGDVCGVFGGGCYVFTASSNVAEAVYYYEAVYYPPNSWEAIPLFDSGDDGVSGSKEIDFCIVPCEYNPCNGGECTVTNEHDFDFDCVCDVDHQGERCELPACTDTDHNLVEFEISTYSNISTDYTVHVAGAVAAEGFADNENSVHDFVCVSVGDSVSFSIDDTTDVYVGIWGFAVPEDDPAYPDEHNDPTWFELFSGNVEEDEFYIEFVFTPCGGGGGDADCYHGECADWDYGWGWDCNCEDGWDSNYCETPICPEGENLVMIQPETEETTQVALYLDGQLAIFIYGNDEWEHQYYVCSDGSFDYEVRLTDSSGEEVSAHVYVQYNWLSVVDQTFTFTGETSVSGEDWNSCNSIDEPCQPHGTCNVKGNSYNCTCEAGWENYDCDWEICEEGKDTLTVRFWGGGSYSIDLGGEGVTENVEDWDARYCVANNTCYEVTVNGEHDDGSFEIYYGANDWFGIDEYYVEDLEFDEGEESTSLYICLGTASPPDGDGDSDSDEDVPPGVGGSASSVVPAVWALLLAVFFALAL